MRQGQKIPLTLTRALWLANGFFWLLLAGWVAFRVQQVIVSGPAPALRLDPVQAEALPPLVLVSVPTRNPFDPAGTAWQAAGSPASEAAPGQVRGIVVLPGVGVAMTDRGAVKPGQALDAGRLVSVKVAGAVVDTPGGRQALVLPGSNRPRLQDLNQAKPTAAKSTAR